MLPVHREARMSKSDAKHMSIPLVADAATAAKRKALARQLALHPHPEQISDQVFISNPFFDPNDLLQVKYEMVRRVQVDGLQIVDVVKAFGVSRPMFYDARAALQSGGLLGLVPRKKGPKRAHKMSAEVLTFIDTVLQAEPQLGAAELAARIALRFGVQVHARSVSRALGRRTKNA